MPRMAYQLIGIVSNDSDRIAHMLNQITGYEAVAFNEAFADYIDNDEVPAPQVEVSPMLITDINTPIEADLIRSLGGVIVNAPANDHKTLKPKDGDISVQLTGSELDRELYGMMTLLFEEFLVEDE